MVLDTDGKDYYGSSGGDLIGTIMHVQMTESAEFRFKASITTTIKMYFCVNVTQMDWFPWPNSTSETNAKLEGSSERINDCFTPNVKHSQWNFNQTNEFAPEGWVELRYVEDDVGTEWNPSVTAGTVNCLDFSHKTTYVDTYSPWGT